MTHFQKEFPLLVGVRWKSSLNELSVHNTSSCAGAGCAKIEPSIMMSIVEGVKRSLLDPSTGGAISIYFRRRRLRSLLDAVGAHSRRISVLDVGGTVAYWESVVGDVDALGFDLTILNLEGRGIGDDRYKFVAGDATSLAFDDGAYDLVYSNSVIEHLSTWENQLKMAAEVVRVGKMYYVQTPNRYFPIEPHFLFPLFQFLPTRVQFEVAIRWPFARASFRDREKARCMLREIRLLSKPQFRKLFPKGRIECERIGGVTKSFTAIGGQIGTEVH